ncbi:3-hydroxyacyl-CoA dehydrogenase NAD-binding domain-containing protein [Variovorax sp. EBFNA2]|uniref:3-hydroxyacyl-CoA dehydrogenase NAD-binding domain-containing protein n=1 Tax=Variovorax sp. EBFNA2 TaxID=3342097 RepID=UPI0029C0AC62|nr:3-hydroxyacyl-CoA dehydrogenase NAD-binding domain-containing protein [Variovorax boronicumulans]WPG41081.1 3-hydroxyacyl-CoA dehydrogenase NAD-binding domain-containing protein [Variovorax boronicumulans]
MRRPLLRGRRRHRHFSPVHLNAALARIEHSRRIVVAMLHGTALGGGLELALACHYRAALPGTRVGLLEVKLGILPGSLGTQRLPRLVGAQRALEMIQTGRMLGTHAARDAGIVDEIVEEATEGGALAAGLAYTQRLLHRSAQPRRLSALGVSPASIPEGLFENALHEATTRKAPYPAARAIVRAVQAAATQPFAQGEALEAKLFTELIATPESASLRHLFFAERQANKIPGLSKNLALRPIRKVGVVGAGTMGGGIAMTLANAGLPTVLLEVSAPGLDRGLSLIRKNYDASAARGKLSAEQVTQRMALIQGTLDDAQIADCDLVIEAVFENMALKMDVVARLGKVCKPGAIIATNTSTLDVDVIAAASGRPQDVLGMHFFSPAHVMRLLEVVRGTRTAPDALATVMKLSSQLGKVAVVSGVCYGFIGNRMAEVYMRETELLLLEGAAPAQIDAAAENPALLGMAMGPCRMLDMAGLDVAAKTLIEREKEDGPMLDLAYRPIVRRLFEQGRHGQKTGSGYYRYEGRTPVAEPETTHLAENLAAQLGIARRTDITDAEIVERLLYPMVAEGARILEEGIAYRASDIDIVWTAGYGFPDHRGGPMYMAGRIGRARIVERVQYYAARSGNAWGYWTIPAQLEKTL